MTDNSSVNPNVNAVHAYDHYFSAMNADNRAVCGQVNPASYAFGIDEIGKVTCTDCRNKIVEIIHPWWAEK